MTRRATLRVRPSDDPSSSLAASLDAVLQSCGRRVPGDELAVVLGDAFLPTYAAQSEPPRQWNVYGRNAFLESAARLYGLELRDLHPPDAAPLPLTPPEFEGHFIDSYLPLIRTALEHDHPALAWMGWPSPDEALWGVVTDIEPTTGRCVGQTIHSSGRPVTMASAPVQVYTVQDYREANPSPVEIIGAALDCAAAMLGHRLGPRYQVVTGVVALEAWRDALREGGDVLHHQRLAMSVIRARETAVRFFREHRDRSADRISAIDEYVRLLSEQTNLLALSMKDPVASMEKMIALERRVAEVGSTS